MFSIKSGGTGFVNISVALVGGFVEGKKEILDTNVKVIYSAEGAAALPESSLKGMLGLEFDEAIRVSVSGEYRDSERYDNKFKDSVITVELAYKLSKNASVSLQGRPKI